MLKMKEVSCPSVEIETEQEGRSVFVIENWRDGVAATETHFPIPLSREGLCGFFDLLWFMKNKARNLA